MKLRKEIIEADKILNKASSQLSFSIINPTNTHIIKKNFLNKKIKNPELKYNPPVENLVEIRRMVSSINIDEIDFVDSFIVEKQADIIRKIDLLNSVGCFDFTEKSRKLYGLPDKRLVDKAYNILNKKHKITERHKIPSKDAIELIKANLKKFNLKYSIKKGNIVSSCVIEPNAIIIKKKVRFSASFINRLIIHEIGTHIFRYENGLQQKLSIFSNGLANYLGTEEGLAVYNEKKFGVLKESYLRNYAGRVIAVKTAQENDFYNTFREIKRFFKTKTAFQLTMRAKRGLSNTSLAGGYTKDHTYFKGYLDVERFMQEGGNIKDLYVGKVGVSDIKFVKKIRLKPPILIPECFILFKEGLKSSNVEVKQK